MNLSNSNIIDFNLEKGEQLLYTKAKQQPLEVDHAILRCLGEIAQFKQKLNNNYDYDLTKHELILNQLYDKKITNKEIIQDKTNEIVKQLFTNLF